MVDLDALDRCAAEAQGWTSVVSHHGLTEGVPPVALVVPYPGRDFTGQAICPSPTRDPAAFVALLAWCAEKGLAPEIHYGLATGSWVAKLYTNADGVVAQERDASPMVALALAVARWKEGAK